ncbi:MAG: MgtC/SapB family protein [Neisseriaceae bacterium]|nr:MAG: MgtC/SapB family protein [Neisseriaceae bacterium]
MITDTALLIEFAFALALSCVIGYIIGAERESRGKDAGISTHIFVIAGAMLFTLMSSLSDGGTDTRIAAQIVSGIGFLGAGLILKEGTSVKNLTTASSIWFAGAIGMTIGFGYYMIAVVAGIASVAIPRIPHIHSKRHDG